ncbi:MAG: hypothetical protein U9R29_05620, partial [Thermodesulfobacteriota bacterium]|nr:hypothetical protein [Thermodesulfobacteriota bacterium]
LVESLVESLASVALISQGGAEQVLLLPLTLHLRKKLFYSGCIERQLDRFLTVTHQNNRLFRSAHIG